jgi:hypothetical protein
VTHEYVIAYNGIIEPRGDVAATAIGWAATAVLAVGSDQAVRAISRGDSTFIDLRGGIVTPLPADIGRAGELVRERYVPGVDIGRLLAESGLLEPGITLEPGTASDLAFWGPRVDPDSADPRPVMRVLETVSGGAFTEGDEHRGHFPEPGI